MKKRLIKILACLLVLITAFSAFSLNAFALSWDGSSQGGGGNTTSAGPNGYAIRTDADNCIGYRFSVVNKAGNNKVAAVIDVFRNTSYGNYEYSNAYKFNTKYNKKQLINNQNSSFSTGVNTNNCYKEASMGFASALPSPGGMSSWQANHNNLNRVLYVLGVGSVNNLKNGDKVLVEPLYDLRLEGHYHAVTVTETALYGKHILGASSNGGTSANSGSWGFISSYTNRYYPNELYTPDGQGLWTGVSAIADKTRATFYDLINKGYGVGIAYTETKPDFTPNLSVRLCEAWKGSQSTRSFHYGSSNGAAFGNYSYANGYPIMGDSVWFAVNFPAESENCYVRQTVWIDGGGSATRKVWSSSGTWYDVSLSPTTVDAGRSSYIVKARADWIDSSGNVLKWGAEKTFYIPVRPKINRYQFTLYSVSGAVAAYAGDAGSSGSVYYGQKVYPKYTFTSDNSWTSYNNFAGVMHEWKNGKWTELWDMQANKIGINKSGLYNKYSSLYPYTVPDNSANTNGINRIPVLLTSEWTSDTAHTNQSRRVDIPIVKADAEITNIRLIDENGYYSDPLDLEAGQKITVQYTYKNNSSCTIYVNGYNSDGSRISGVYAIAAGKSINVNGYSFEVPNRRSFSVWGGVYLDGVGIYNTRYESNRNNNAMTLNCEVNHPLRISPITPNAAYREDTWVVSSFWVSNGYRDNYIPSDDITVKFTVSRTNGSQITAVQKNAVVVPGNDKNLVYFKWKVPAGLSYQDVVISACIVDDGVEYNRITRRYSTIPYLYSETPDTQFEETAPSGFSVASTPSGSSGNAIWWEYQYVDGSFQKQNYGIGIYNSGKKTITPATGATAVQNGSDWTMKSGYGISLRAYNALSTISGYILPSTVAYTGIQYAYAALPEYGYSAAYGKCRTLEKADNYWGFRQNGSYGRVHFTPLWYPNGNYSVKIVKSDFWTPSGMVTASVVTNAIQIKGSAYDDWHVGRK